MEVIPATLDREKLRNAPEFFFSSSYTTSFPLFFQIPEEQLDVLFGNLYHQPIPFHSFINAI